MKTSLKSLVSTALLAALAAGAPSAVKASDFKPLGEGAQSALASSPPRKRFKRHAKRGLIGPR